MKKQTQDSNPYKAFDEYMIRQSSNAFSLHKIDDNDQNDLRSAHTRRGRSADIEFFDGEFEESQPAGKQFVFSARKVQIRAVPVNERVRSSNTEKNNNGETVRIWREKRSNDDSPDREGFSEKREGGRKKVDHENDGLESAEDKDPVLVVSGEFRQRPYIRRNDRSDSSLRRWAREQYNARRSG